MSNLSGMFTFDCDQEFDIFVNALNEFRDYDRIEVPRSTLIDLLEQINYAFDPTNENSRQFLQFTSQEHKLALWSLGHEDFYDNLTPQDRALACSMSSRIYKLIEFCY